MRENEIVMAAIYNLIEAIDRISSSNDQIVKQNNALILLLAGETVQVEDNAVETVYLNGRKN